MDEPDELEIFLAGPARKELEDYMNRLGPEILNHSEGAAVRAEYCRNKWADWTTMEIVIVDTIEFRISGPVSDATEGGSRPTRRARSSGRGRGARAGSSKTGKKVRH